MSAWQSSGPHRYYSEGDFVFWHMVDAMDEVNIEALLAAVDAALRQFQRSVLLVDCSQATLLKPEARRRYAEWLKTSPYPNRASIFFAASGEMQAFLLLAQRAGQLASGQRSAIEIVKDEPAAHKRAEELRASWATPK